MSMLALETRDRAPLPLRPYQAQALDAIGTALARGIRRQLIVIPTGGGKTVVFSHLVHRRQGRALVLAHRDELISQAADKLATVGGSLDIGIVKAQQDDCGARVVVASVQTLASEIRLRRIGRFDTVIVDEAHHAVASTYLGILDGLGCMAGNGPLTVGVTATAGRSDKVGLGAVWQEVTYQRGILQMIAEGYLCDVKCLEVTSEFDIGNAQVRAGDFTDSSLGAELERSGAIEAAAVAYAKHAGDRPGIAFTPTIATAHELSAALRSQGIRAEAVDGTMPLEERRAVLARVHQGETQVVANCAVLTEGFDEPRISCALMCRPTKSAPFYCFDAATEVLTPDGWVLGRTVAAGETISTFDPDTGEVAWGKVLGRIERALMPGERMMAIKSPTIDIRVTDTHRVVWKPRSGTKWQVNLAGEVARHSQSWQLPVAGMERFPGVPLTDAELSFIGWVQTDGTVNHATGAVQITQQRPDQIAHIEQTLTACGFKWGRHIGTDEMTNYGRRRNPQHTFWISRGTPRGQDRHLRGWGDLAPYLPKADPEAWGRLERMTADQWRVLLDAWHCGDGSKQEGQTWTRRSYHLAIARREVADWVQAQCMRRGWRANVAAQADLWMVHCREGLSRWVGGTSNTDRPGFRDSPSFPGELVWCVSVPTGAILTRRSGKGAVVGQTQMIGRVLRPYPGKNDALVLDVAGASSQAGLCTIADLAGLPPGSVKNGKSLLEADEERQAAEQRKVAVRAQKTRQVNLLRRSDLRWLQADDAWILPAGANQVMILMPAGDEAWDVWRAVQGEPAVRESGQPLTLDWAQGVGEEIARAQGGILSQAKAGWRTKEPTGPQVAALQRLGYADRLEGLTRGAAADLMTVHFAARDIRKLRKAGVR
jgi:superfamily II DNA or RNA helicase